MTTSSPQNSPTYESSDSESSVESTDGNGLNIQPTNSLTVQRQDSKVQFKYHPQMAQESAPLSMSDPSLFSGSTMVSSQKDGEAVTKQVMDNMDALFGVMNETLMGNTEKIKIVLTKTAESQIHMKVKSYAASPSESPATGRPQLDMVLQKPEGENAWMSTSISTVSQQLRDLQAEVTALRGQLSRTVLAGFTEAGVTRWEKAPESFLLKTVLQAYVDLTPYHLPRPPTTVIAQLYETKYAAERGTAHYCAISNVTAGGFWVKVKNFRGGMKRAQRRRWHIYFMCAY